MINSIGRDVDTVASVHQIGLCCSCGFCIGSCPNGAISYEIDTKGFFRPVIDNGLCTGCRKCIESCPGFRYLDTGHGTRNESYSYGYSNNPELREESSSGGVVTELLCYLVRNKVVDYVTVIRNRKKLDEPCVDVTNDLDVIIASSTSKYCPVRYGEVLKTLEGLNGRIAVMGLPCQIQAIKKYFNGHPSFNIEIKYFLSLFCNHLPSFAATDYVLHNTGISCNDVESIRYRGGGWPGYFQISTKHKDFRLPYRETVAVGFGKYFKNVRCLLCTDPFGELADISFADAYFLNPVSNSGSTMCVVRNRAVDEILQTMNDEGFVTLEKGPGEVVYKAMVRPLTSRCERVPLALCTLKVMRRKVPLDHPPLPARISLGALLNNLIQLTRINLGRYKFLWKLLFRMNRGSAYKEKIVFTTRLE